jgi:hypothetical protein
MSLVQLEIPDILIHQRIVSLDYQKIPGIFSSTAFVKLNDPEINVDCSMMMILLVSDGMLGI